MSGITNPAEEYFKDGLWGWDGSAWQKLPLLFGYHDRWVENLGSPDTGGGSYTGNSTPVPEGYIYVMQVLSCANDTGARGMVRIYARIGGLYLMLGMILEPLKYEPCYFSGAVVLKEGDYVTVKQLLTGDDDMIIAGVAGYIMKIT